MFELKMEAWTWQSGVVDDGFLKRSSRAEEGNEWAEKGGPRVPPCLKRAGREVVAGERQEYERGVWDVGRGQ